MSQKRTRRHGKPIQKIRLSPKRASNPATVDPEPDKSVQERYTVAQVVAALRQTRGMVAAAARALGCIRPTIYSYRDRHPEVKEAMEESKEMQLDVTELKLFMAIDKGDAWAVCFYLKCHGRTRGYIERQDLNVKAKVTGGVLLMPTPALSAEEWKQQSEKSA